MSSDDMPPPLLQREDAAIIFKPDGSVELVVPDLRDRPGDEDVPAYILAATELLMVASENGVEILAEAFEERVKEGH
jgi:hypothetical protein